MKSRLAASIALAAALIVGATGCTFSAEIATEKEYDPSDGVGAEVGELAIRNALLIGETGDELNLVMTVASAADVDRRLTVQWEAAGERVTEAIVVAAGDRTRVGGPDDENQIVITGSGATIGGLVPVFFAYNGAAGVEVLVPVLDGALPEYELYIP
ncbi:MAG: DNA modification methylase [Microbacteriaceae bacterium]|nr:DNA modification methylase [Microbacteriaceae bacterium]